MNILLVYPRSPNSFWNYQHVMKLIGKRAVMPPLGLLTVAAMLPREWNLKFVDMNTAQLEDAQIRWADYVLVSAVIIHKQPVRELAARCIALGKTMVAGGPLFTTGYQEFPEIKHFVLGEAEELMEEVVADMMAGTLKSVYRAEKFPNVSKTPAPRWDIVNLVDYFIMPLQASRGCPYTCEFCDIIEMYGRVPRVKNAQQFVAELEALRQAGWRAKVFIVDDNFIGNRKYARGILEAMLEWRKKTNPVMEFMTEASANLASNPELCDLMVQNGFKKVFVGIETPLEEGLEECDKVPNRKRDLLESIRTLQRAGLHVAGGFIIGFDSDPPDIFERQLNFIQDAGVSIAMLSLLSALPQTALYRRLEAEGRLLTAATGNNTDGSLNFVPRMDRNRLVSEFHRLSRRIYEPEVYYRRVRNFLEVFKPRGPSFPFTLKTLWIMLKIVWLLGVKDEGRGFYWRLFASTAKHAPEKIPALIDLGIVGYHYRKVSEELHPVSEPQPSELNVPVAAHPALQSTFQRVHQSRPGHEEATAASFVPSQRVLIDRRRSSDASP